MRPELLVVLRGAKGTSRVLRLLVQAAVLSRGKHTCSFQDYRCWLAIGGSSAPFLRWKRTECQPVSIVGAVGRAWSARELLRCDSQVAYRAGLWRDRPRARGSGYNFHLEQVQASVSSSVSWVAELAWSPTWAL